MNARIGRTGALLLALLCLPLPVASQQSELANYPNRPITFIIPLPPGATGDLSVRLLIRSAEKHLGQPLVPVNKPGAGSIIGIAELAKAKPDGYTVGYSVFGPMLVSPFLQKVPYHPVNDFTQVIQFSTANTGLVVRADSPYQSLKEIIADARSKKLSFGGMAIGLNATIMQKIGQKEGVEIVHIPYGGGVLAETALLGRHVDMVAGDFSPSNVESGRTRLLVLWREERSEEYPRTPILKELGYDMPLRLFSGVQVPKGVPEGIVRKLEEAFTLAVREPEFVKGMKELRFPILYRNSRELNEYVAKSYELYREFLK